MGDLKFLSGRMRIRARNIGKGMNNKMRRAGLGVDQAVVISTPVDKGEARSNWLASLTSPRSGTISPYSPGDKLGISEQANASGALAQGRAVISRRKPGQDIYIQNNSDHIGVLNDGSSRQAPAQFVELGVQSGLRAARVGRVIDGD